jgi:hypothetical protein
MLTNRYILRSVQNTCIPTSQEIQYGIINTDFQLIMCQHQRIFAGTKCTISSDVNIQLNYCLIIKYGMQTEVSFGIIIGFLKKSLY